ncbi:hypothetical protein CRUP_032942, partial [Coryphaenoides rupestris]
AGRAGGVPVVVVVVVVMVMVMVMVMAEFSEINLVSNSNGTCTVDLQVVRERHQSDETAQSARLLTSTRSFRPDFVLVRQHAFSMTQNEDFKNMIIGLQYAGVPSVNSLESIYSLSDKPWAVSD